MPNNFAGQVFPVPNRFVGFGKEPAGVSGTPVAPTNTFPMKALTPADKITYLEDDAWRGAMAGLYNIIQGVEISDLSMSGPFFADSIGYILAGILGDYWQSVTGAAGSATTSFIAAAVGATQVTVNTGTGFASGTVFAIGALGTNAEEVRKISSVTGGTVFTFSPPLYQAHGSGATVTAYPVVTTVSHNFALLNGTGAGMGGFSNAQPPTYSITDSSGVPAGTGARVYSYAVPTELAFTGTSTGLVDWDAKYTAIASTINAVTPTNTVSPVAPQPSWNTTVTVGGVSKFNNVEYKVSLMRKAAPVFANNAQQAPFAIPRGWFTADFGLNFDPSTSEFEFLQYLGNSQPTLVIASSNGLAGTSAASITYTAQIAAFDTGVIADKAEAFGFDLTGKFVANTTNVGPSAGFGPLVVTLVNSVIAY